MRAKLRDVVKRRRWAVLADWWFEWPPRRRRFWRTLLLEPGQGWLRWRIEWHSEWRGDEPPEEFPVAPPLHRAWMNVRYVWGWLLHEHEGGFSLNASAGYWRDPDRSKELWR